MTFVHSVSARRFGFAARTLVVGVGLFAGALLHSTAGRAAPDPAVVGLYDRQNGDRLMIVDCLLPGQVRQLGTGVTYLAPRRAVKTAESDCAIRGGEYTASDRANYSTALKVWLPQANGGDKVAQTYVGEIYEKGLGTPPDYVQASLWYKRAADQGYTRAYINLGYLYEQGLGVAKDPAMALNLYRKAAGIQGSINLDGAPAPASKEELDGLRKELERARQDLEKARRELDQERLKSSQEIERLLKKKQEAAAAGNTEETRRLEAQLKERETELEKRRRQVARSEQTNEDYKARLSRLEGESASLRKDLEQAQRQLAQSQREIEDKKSTAAEAERRVAAMQQELARQKNAPAPPDPARIKQLEAELQKTRTDFERQKQEVARLETDVSGYKDKVAKLESKPEPPTQKVSMAPPSIQIIDPPVVITRDTATVKVRSGVASRPLSGQVTAPAGLLSFTVNDVRQEVDAEGFFTTSIDLRGGKTRMSLVAVDRHGKRTPLEFFMEPEAATAAAAPAPKPRISGQSLGLGNFYALVVGNQNYQKLPRLNTPEADAADLAALLKERYGFNVTLLLNATRLQMLEELNKMGKVLTEKDNLLIYYAGHGEFDKVNSLANWLPIDADPTSDANWIQSSRITEKLNTFAAKHVLVVADSCYSGAMTRSSIGQVQTTLTDEERFRWLKEIAAAGSRTVLTSGGVSPVMDGGGGRHSVFAQTFIDVLTENRDLLPGMDLSRTVSARVTNIAKRQNFDQRPEYAPIRFAGGESGDFIFVPTK